jgi:hypothetical protein
MKQQLLKRLRFIAGAITLTLQLRALLAADDVRDRAAAPPNYNFKVSANPTDAAACRQRLHKIREAITGFEADHQRLPHWLSELTGEYLDEKLLICPYVEKIADFQSWRYGIRGDVFEDPKKSTSYAYEFCNKELTLWTGVKKTWGDYKRRQMELVGEAVPIVRCFAHDPVLNLPFRGEIYESGQDWESRHPQFSHNDLHPETLFYHLPPQTNSKPFPKRSLDIDRRLLDLSPRYNAYLDEPWLPFLPDSNLNRLPPGTHEFGGMRFDVRGLIQLKGNKLLAPYPIVVNGIKVGQACTNIHFLHGTHLVPIANVNDGAKVASYVVNYQSGAQAEIPIVYGRDVKNWWYDPNFPDPDKARAVWKGDNQAAAAQNSTMIRLFLTSWKNPWKDQPIESLSLVSAMGETAPFVVAITVE